MSNYVDLYPAYCFNCARCKQPVYVNVTTLAIGGKRNFILGRNNPTHASQIYNLDLNIWEIRMQGINATPPGMNIQLLSDRVSCDACKAEYQVSSIKKLLDAGAYNCEKCFREGHIAFTAIEEKPSEMDGHAQEIVKAVQNDQATPKMLLMLAVSRVIVAGQQMIVLDRLSQAPATVNCLYCGSEWATRLLEPSPLK